jgi:hypothetical protein
MLSCCDHTVRNRIESGDLDSWRLTEHGWHRVTLDSIRAFLARREQT